MDAEIQEIREKLDELSELVKENTRMTKSIYRKAKWASFFVAIKWVIIIGLTVGSFYYLQPYLETLLKIYSSIPGVGHASGASTGNSALDFFKSL